MLSIAEESLLINLVENTVDGLWVVLHLFFIFIREFLLGSFAAEGRMVGNKGKIQAIMREQLIEVLGFKVRPLAGVGLIVVLHAV